MAWQLPEVASFRGSLGGGQLLAASTGCETARR